MDAPYPGNGSNQPCAWDHPFRALEPSGEPGVAGTARIAAGDTLIIASAGYRVGYGAPGAHNCQSDYPWDCHMPPVPSGADPAHPTRILGEGWDSGCVNPPELWGAERVPYVLNLADASNVVVACLEITDHSDCVDGHTGELACKRDSYPYGNWAADGLYAEDSADVRLEDLNIHGLAEAGVRAGRLTDWTVEDVRIAHNGWVGWEGDIEGDDANTGTLTFRRWTVEQNGCGETYPGGEPTGCWAQTAGGYGDGVGTGATGGDWIIEDSAFLYNTSDGLDLLYHRLGGSIVIRRTIAEGNAGDQIKATGPTLVENVIAVSHCGFFEGKPFTHNVDNCRAGGSALAFTVHPGDQITVVNATVTGEGDCLIIAECAEGESCIGRETVRLRNDIFQGHPEFNGGDDTTCLAWTDMAGDLFAIDHTLINGLKGTPDPCPPNSLCHLSPGLVGQSIDNFDAHLAEGSRAIDAGTTEGAPADDFDGHPRDAHPDMGAYERRKWMPTYRLYLPMILKDYAHSPTPTATPSPTPTSTPTAGDCPNYPSDFGFVTGMEVYPVPAMTEPAPRQWFTDPSFGTCLVRVTDRVHDPSPGDSSPGLKNEYARVQSFNADGSRILARGTEMTWYLYDAQTLGPPLGELPLAVEPRWDSVDPDLIYYSDVDERRLMAYNVRTTALNEVHDFAPDFPGQNVVAVWTAHEGRPSRDRRYWGLMAEDDDWIPVAFLVYDRQTDGVTIRDMRGVPEVEDDVDHVTISPLGNYFLASFDHGCEPGALGNDTNPCGLMVYDRDLTSGRGLLRVIGHYDVALDAQEREVVIYQDIDTDHISMLDLETGAVTALWEIDFSHTAIGLHFSGLAFDRPGWALVSTHDDESTTYTWMDDQIFAIELKPGGRVIRLAHTHSLVNDDLELDYWAEPHATVNSDMTRLLFTTDWGRSGTGEVEMFMIALPSNWLERLQ